MKRTVLLFLLCFISWVGMQAQNANFTVTVSTDSILMDNYFQVSFTLENAQGTEFEAPSFSEFEVVSGPNMSSSFNMINGTTTQTVSYSYYLRPKDIGNYYIQPASIKTGENYLETEPLEVLVVPNPDGIQQNPQQQLRTNPFGSFEDFFNNDNFFRAEDFFKDMPQQQAPNTEETPAEKKKKKRKTYKL